MRRCFLVLFFMLAPWAFSQGANITDRLKACLGALSQDQAAFFKSSGHFAAHVDLLESSERSVCFGISLHLSRISKKEFMIQATADDQTWQTDHKKNLEIIKPKGP